MGTGGADGFQIISAGSTSVHINQRESANMFLRTNNDEKMMITNNGRVGIGRDIT